jgi:hypothetical protein
VRFATCQQGFDSLVRFGDREALRGAQLQNMMKFAAFRQGETLARQFNVMSTTSGKSIPDSVAGLPAAAVGPTFIEWRIGVKLRGSGFESSGMRLDMFDSR